MAPGNNRRGFFDPIKHGWCDVKSKFESCASQKYEKIGDGGPHQNFVIMQRTGSQVHCTSESDSIGNEVIFQLFEEE